MDGQIVLGYEPKFRRFEITSALTSGADIRPKTSVVGSQAEVVGSRQMVACCLKAAASLGGWNFRLQAKADVIRNVQNFAF